MRKTWLFCSLCFVMGATSGATIVLHFASQQASHWLEETKTSNAAWKRATDTWQEMYNGCQAKFNVATVLYEPRPAAPLSLPVAGGALQLSIGLAGTAGIEQSPAWLIPAQVTPRAAKQGFSYQWIDAQSGEPRGAVQFAEVPR